MDTKKLTPEEEIIERNTLIAEFMGPGSPVWQGFEHKSYHSSWDWLIPVVEKISNFRAGEPDKEGYTFGRIAIHIGDNYPRGWKCHILGNLTIQHINPNNIHTYSKSEDFSSVSYSDKDSEFINPVWLSVVQFIQWYNSLTNK